MNIKTKIPLDKLIKTRGVTVMKSFGDDFCLAYSKSKNKFWNNGDWVNEDNAKKLELTDMFDRTKDLIDFNIEYIILR